MSSVDTMPDNTHLFSSVQTRNLPPLILHPFSSVEDSSVLVESSRASLVLQGLLPDNGHSQEELDRSLLRGRYAEVRMLFYVGKDLNRWLDQCAEVAQSEPALAKQSFTAESFIPLLVENVPASVRRKLEAWGVVDFTALFRRAIGLHTVFSEPPPAECLNQDFLRRYHRYMDQWFDARMLQNMGPRCTDVEFTYELYASGEYAQMLEQTWQ
jgi:hypothetical protein